MTLDLFDRLADDPRATEFATARELDLLPYFRTLDCEAGPAVLMEEHERIMLGSNNYLGLTGDPRVKAAARDALERYGTALTGSRLLNGTLTLHLELEREIAGWMGTEDALVFTTGYQANVGCIGTLLQRGDTVICDSLVHASIIDAITGTGARMRPFRHGNMDRLRRALRAAQNDGGGVLVVVEGIYSMEGDVCDVAAVVDLCREYGARLLVDEAHSVGVLGDDGTGAARLFGVDDQVDLRMGTFSKSLASCGGFIAGPAAVIDHLRINARSFLFTAASVPAALGAALAAIRICRSEEGSELFARVLDNARYLARGLRELGYEVVEPEPTSLGEPVAMPIVPVRVGEDWAAVRLWKALYEAGVYTNVALYPAVPPGQALIRTSVMATHERDHLDRALSAFERVRSSHLPTTPRAIAA